MNAHKRMDANRLVEEKPISVFAPMYGKEKWLQKIVEISKFCGVCVCICMCLSENGCF